MFLYRTMINEPLLKGYLPYEIVLQIDGERAVDGSIDNLFEKGSV